MALASWGTYARPRKLKKICLTVAGRQRKVNILICRQPRLLLRGGRQGSTYPNVMERLTGWTFHQAKPRLSSLVSLLSLSVFGPALGLVVRQTTMRTPCLVGDGIMWRFASFFFACTKRFARKSLLSNHNLRSDSLPPVWRRVKSAST